MATLDRYIIRRKHKGDVPRQDISHDGLERPTVGELLDNIRKGDSVEGREKSKYKAAAFRG